MGKSPRLSARAAQFCAILIAGALAPAQAGPLGLPVPQPGPILHGTLEKARETTKSATDTVTGTVDGALAGLGFDAAGRPVDPGLFEQDENGARIVRGVVIAIALSDRGRRAAADLGIAIAASEDFDPLNIDVTRLELPPELAAARAIVALRAADPEGRYDFEHVYDPAGEAGAGAARHAPTLVSRDDIEIGMIDAGIERTHPALRDAEIVIRATTRARGASRATAHGTAVASLLVGDDAGFSGALPGATLYAADAFAGSATGGTAGDIARAIAWLVDEGVPVINISITGPKNALLEAAVNGAIARGHVVVAPVGNDGPAVGVKFPAGYDGVVAVTAVDEQRQIMLDANRGPAVAFAANGVDVRAAQLSARYASVTGTSFASPLVAARFAEMLPKADASLASAARDALIASAVPPGAARRDAIFGYGVLAPPEHAAAGRTATR